MYLCQPWRLPINFRIEQGHPKRVGTEIWWKASNCRIWKPRITECRKWYAAQRHNILRKVSSSGIHIAISVATFLVTQAFFARFRKNQIRKKPSKKFGSRSLYSQLNFDVKLDWLPYSLNIVPAYCINIFTKKLQQLLCEKKLVFFFYQTSIFFSWKLNATQWKLNVIFKIIFPPFLQSIMPFLLCHLGPRHFKRDSCREEFTRGLWSPSPRNTNPL